MQMQHHKFNNFTRLLTGRMSSQVRYFVVIEQREDNAQRDNRKGCPKRQQDAWKVHVHTTYAIKRSDRFHANVEPFVECKSTRLLDVKPYKCHCLASKSRHDGPNPNTNRKVGSQYPEYWSDDAVNIICIER